MTEARPSITIELDVYDLDQVVRQHLQARYPQFEITGWSASSWNTAVIEVTGDMLEHPVRHAIRPKRAALPWGPAPT